MCSKFLSEIQIQNVVGLQSVMNPEHLLSP